MKTVHVGLTVPAAFGALVLAFLALGTFDAEAGPQASKPCDDSSNPCKVTSLQTRAIPYGRLPACVPLRAGQMQETTDAGYQHCTGSAWASMGGTGASSDTCTGTACNIGYTGFVADAGYTGWMAYGSFTAGWTGASYDGDGGSRSMGVFNCGSKDAQLAHGVQCLTNQTGPLEISGYAKTYGAGVDVCSVELQSVEARGDGYLVCAQNGPTKVWAVGIGGSTYQDGLLHFRQAGQAYIIADQGPSYIEMVGNHGTGGAVVALSSAGTWHDQDDFIQGYVLGVEQWGIGKRGALKTTVNQAASTTDPLAAIDIQGTGPLARSNGIAFASFQPCNADAGSLLQYASDNKEWYRCNGTAWAQLATPTSWLEGFAANCPAADTTGCLAEEADFIGPMKQNGGGSTSASVGCSWLTQGSGGSTGVVVAIHGVTEAADICTCNLGACNGTARTPKSCTCSGTFVAGRSYTLQFDTTTDCATNPSETLCNVQFLH